MPRGPETTIATGGAPAGGPRLLLIAGEAHVGTHVLPDGATLTLGRDPGCEIPIAHPKISRRHASFHGGPPVEVEDLGSTNGVLVGGRRLAAGARASLTGGESVQIGPFVVTLLDAPRDTTGDTPAYAAIPILDPTPAGIPEVARRVAQGTVSVLITGETGAGKEVLARTLHELSGRKGELVAVNCATLGEHLLESELFGYEKGAFTGATRTKPGLFEVAAGGTLLLDEIGELPLPLQAKLLRVLETRLIYRLGAVKPVSLDARFLAATYRDLAQDVAEGRFRRDLYFRVNGITLAVAPLRERGDDIRALATSLLAEAARAVGREPPRFDAAALAALARHDWPGNVRELRTVVERALLMEPGDELRAGHILFDRLPPAMGSDDGGKTRLVAAATEHKGNVTEMARALGTSRSQIRRLALRYGLELDRYR